MQHRTRLRALSEMQIPTRGPSALTAAVAAAGTRQPFCTQTSTDLLLLTAAGDTCPFDPRREERAGRSRSPALPGPPPRQGSEGLPGQLGRVGRDPEELGRACPWESVPLGAPLQRETRALKETEGWCPVPSQSCSQVFVLRPRQVLAILF